MVQDEIEMAKNFINEAISIGCQIHEEEFRLNRIELYIDHIQLRGRYWFLEPKIIYQFNCIISPRHLIVAMEELEVSYQGVKNLQFFPYEKMILIGNEEKG